jgi:hypothetical protein
MKLVAANFQQLKKGRDDLEREIDEVLISTPTPPPST